MLQPRRGSVLAMAVSLTTVFLTLIIAGIGYVETSTKATKNNRYRDLAEQAARSGLDFVLGWGEQNIDRESRLPADWESLNDGGTLDPVSQVVRTQPKTSLRNAANPGELLGTNLREYVLTRTGPYVVSFKARVQQYRISENMPRQYRIGVVGRVRKVPSSGDVDPDNDERANVVAERMIVANIGREPASRYAALIDFDSVKNWVPGEITSGPVHINRGYVDEVGYRNQGINPISTTANLTDPDPNVGSLSSAAARSVMLLHSSTSNAGFGPVVRNGITYTTPVFEDPVSVTSIAAGDPVYTNADPNSLGSFVKVNTGAEGPYSSGSMPGTFRAQENQGRTEWGGGPGPIVRTQPVELPKSVRGALSAALGVPMNRSIYDYRGWFNRNLEDGVYIPTTSWWDGSQLPINPISPPAQNNPIPGGFAYQPGEFPVGGIYVRGNIEIMRMGVEGPYSYYLFQLGYGSVTSPVNIPSSSRRTYGVLVNRTTRQTFIRTWRQGVTLDTIYGVAPNPMARDLFNGIDGLAGGRWPVPSNNAQIDNYRIDRDGEFSWSFGAKPLPSAANPLGSEFAFNGVVFVDLSARDPARHLTNPLAISIGGGVSPLTGNIFALGDPGVGAAPNVRANKRQLSNNREDRVATYRSITPSDIASKLTIMTTGNIFIQNDIILQSLTGFNLNNIGQTGNQPTINDSKDLLGLVADKQIVVGLYAPSTTTRGANGVMVHAAIAALGDPGLDYTFATPKVPAIEITQVPRSYRGSFTTEGIMQEFSSPIREQYNVCFGAPNRRWFATNSTENTPNSSAWGSADAPQLGFPGNPIYQQQSPGGPIWNSNRASNPNRQVRGNMLVFGSITQKKRGVIGVSNRSYDKDFRFDRRLLTIAPPIFPSSTNVIIRNIDPFSPSDTDPNTRYPYRSGATIAGNAGDPLRFMSALP